MLPYHTNSIFIGFLELFILIYFFEITVHIIYPSASLSTGGDCVYSKFAGDGVVGISIATSSATSTATATTSASAAPGSSGIGSGGIRVASTSAKATAAAIAGFGEGTGDDIFDGALEAWRLVTTSARNTKLPLFSVRVDEMDAADLTDRAEEAGLGVVGANAAGDGGMLVADAFCK